METRSDFFFKVIFMVALGAAGSLWYLSSSERCKNLIHQKIVVMLERDYGVHFSGKLSSLSLMRSSVSFVDVVCCPTSNPGQWRFCATQLSLSISLPKLLLQRTFFVSVQVLAATLFSQVKNNSICFIEFIKEMFKKPSHVQTFLDSCSCMQWQMQLVKEEDGSSATLKGDLNIIRAKEGYTSVLTLSEGEGIFHNKKAVSNLAGTIVLAVPVKGRPRCALTLAAQLPAFLGEEEYCYVTGEWVDKEGRFSCDSEKKSVVFKKIDLILQDEGPYLVVEGDFSLAACMSLLQFPSTYNVSGRCEIKGSGTMTKTFHGSTAIREGRVAGWLVEDAATSFVMTPTGIQGTMLYHQQTEQIAGVWSLDYETKQLLFEIKNTTPFTLFGTQWYLPQEKMRVKGDIFLKGKGTFDYQIGSEHLKTEERWASRGSITSTPSEVQGTGVLELQTSSYAMRTNISQLQDFFLVTLCDAMKEGAPPVVSIDRHGQEMQVKVELAFLQQLLHDYGHSGVIAQGTMLMKGRWHGSEVRGVVDVSDAVIRRPGMYNFIHGLHADFSCNVFKRLLTLENVEIDLHKGKIESRALSVGYDFGLKGAWAHLPFIFSDCFVNWKKDLYVLLSGAVVGKKNPDEDSSLVGFMVLDKAQLNENIFSQKTQDFLMNSLGDPSGGYKITTDIAVTSRSPVTVKTNEVETEAHLALELSTQATQQRVKGTITLQGGAIHFPAHSLSIVKGKLIFVPEHPQDPFIEVIAQARIKKYLITFSIGGTGQDPQLLFDSVPALPEEQIMMLLLSGSEEESFNIVAPALIMRNMEKIVFGSSYRSRHNAWLEPLKRIRFVPRFTDQTGRGGFKGALEIEVSKKLRAMIEKNFSLTEDVAYEVEYLLTDDMSLRASCDERGDLGAELEMRFKF